jgi:hypothetical protein
MADYSMRISDFSLRSLCVITLKTVLTIKIYINRHSANRRSIRPPRTQYVHRTSHSATVIAPESWLAQPITGHAQPRRKYGGVGRPPTPPSPSSGWCCRGEDHVAALPLGQPSGRQGAVLDLDALRLQQQADAPPQNAPQPGCAIFPALERHVQF